MTKAELIDHVVKAVDNKNLTKKLAAEVVDAAFAGVKTALLEDGRFSFPGFGTFTVKTRKARKGRNPQTKEVIDIPERKTVSFKPAPRLRDDL
jgi:DNA-binding protein HU-beta